jgi:uncharacterized protein (DUF2062 family)
MNPAMPRPLFATPWLRLQLFWRERVVALIVAQLRQGISPQKVALTLALGLCLAAFPIIGATSALCFLAALCLRLNQPIIQLVNWLASPLQLGLLVVFVRQGEWLARAPRVSFSIPELFAKFHASPANFFQEFGLTGVHGIIGWASVAPLAGLLLYFLFLPITKKLAAAPPVAEKTKLL